VFNLRQQLHEETIEQYVRVLYTLAESCDFHDKKEAIRDRFIVGLKDNEISKTLQLVNGLTLDDAIKQARQIELAKNQMSELSTQAQGKSQNDSVKSKKPTHFNKQRHHVGKRNLQTQYGLHRKLQG
jgi:hypothetical protein